MIKEIALFVATKSGLALGTRLQCAHRTPASPDRCSVVLESGGGSTFASLPDRINKMIQVISRGKTYMNAHDDAWTIFNALHGTLAGSVLPLGSRTMPAIAPATQNYEVIIDPVTDPQYIGPDDKGRYEFSCNYIFRIINV